MRVLHVAECIGGVDRYLKSYLKYSSCENIMILSQLYKKNDYERLVKQVEIMNMKHSIGFSAVKEAIQLRSKIKKYNPNIVYAHSSIAGAITRMACIGVNVKVVYNPHGWSFNMESKKKNLYIILERIMAKFCDAIICISEAEKKSAIKYRICKENKLHVVYNGIDFQEYKKEEVVLPIPNDVFVVGMVGRICKQKAPDIFIRMAYEVQKKVSNVYFVIVGDVIEEAQEEKKYIEDLAKSLGVKLLITGWVENPLAYMSRFDVGCLLSRWEGFGLTIPEYMITGVAIVASSVDAIPYLINDGEEGLLVGKDDWNSAADKVIELLNDTKKREKIVKNAKKTVRKRFDAKRVSKECENIFETLVNV